MDRIIQRFWRRLRTDPPFAILSLMGLFGILGVSPFIVFRAMEGNHVVAVADTIMVLTTIGSVIFAWVTHDTARAASCWSASFPSWPCLSPSASASTVFSGSTH